MCVVCVWRVLFDTHSFSIVKIVITAFGAGVLGAFGLAWWSYVAAIACRGMTCPGFQCTKCGIPVTIVVATVLNLLIIVCVQV